MSSGSPQLRQQRHIGRVGKDRGLEPGHAVHPHRGNVEHVLDRDQALDHVQRLAHRRGVADDPEHQLGLRMRRHHVGRHAAVDEPDRVVRAAQLDVLGQLHAAHHHQRVEQLVDRRLPQLGKRRVRGAARRDQPHAQDAAGGDAEPVVGRLAVDQVAHARRRALRWPRARRRCRALRRRRTAAPTRVSPRWRSRSAAATCAARMPLASHDAAADQHAALDAAREERRHAVVVRGQHHRRRRPARRTR